MYYLLLCTISFIIKGVYCVSMAQATTDGEWKCVDDRPFECPNGDGLLEIESSTSVYCPDCGYTRTVIDYVEN